MGRARGWGPYPLECEERLRNDGSDRISDLPDSILGEILSRLPIKNAIGTSVLSTRWKPLFPSLVPLTQLDLDDSDVFYPYRQNGSDSFIGFMDKLLNVTLRDAGYVEKVVINCANYYGDAKICSWVSAALRLKVRHLRLMRYVSDSVPLLNSLHGCTTLVELVLGREFKLDVPGEFSLRNLERLSLYFLSLDGDVDCVRKLIAGCPVLNDLSILGCDVSEFDDLYIRHPFITKLSMEHCSIYGEGEGEEVGRVIIDAPKLETFVHKGYFISEYVCENVKSLHSVYIDMETESHAHGRRLARLVEACSGTTCLYLYGNSVVALYRSSIGLPTFQNLTCLTLSYMGRRGSGGWEMLARFLKSAPKLEVLTFTEELLFMGAYEGFNLELPSVPICLEQRLQKIEFRKFEWTEDEINLIEYILKQGRELRQLIVHCLPSEDRSITKKLSMLPRQSKVCRVLFI